MNEFLNRVDAQRMILNIVNTHAWEGEPLFSLTRKSLERWILSNESITKKLSDLLFLTADKLFFLANKSQEQITDDYKNLSKDIYFLTIQIENEIKNIK